MPRCVLSSIGTSLLTNGAPRDLADLLRKTANETTETLQADARSRIDGRIEEVGQALRTASVKERRRLSAELNGLHGLFGDRLAQTPPDIHFLLATDTYQGRATANLVREVLEREDAKNVQVEVPPRLSTRNQSDFAHGIRALVRWCEETLVGYRESGYSVVFNLVGSFKSLQGYLNTIGMFYADEIIYIFEDPAASLLPIPRLPVQLDLSFLRRHRDLVAQLAEGRTVSPADLRGWPELLWQEDAPGQAWLSTWGELLWQRGKDELLATDLLRLPRLHYATSFERDFAKHANQRERVQLQEKLAKVSVLLQLHAGDTSALKRDGGLQYDNYAGKHHNLGHFRVSQAVRVSCRAKDGELTLLHFGGHDYVNDNPE